MEVYGLCCAEARKYGHRLLAWGAGRHWGLHPLPEICREERGKPFFAGVSDRCFNISHSGDWVVCALDDRPLGVDIQKIRPCREGLLERVCSPEEQEWYRERGRRERDFALLWSMKESLCKYTGQGLTLPVSNIRVPLPREGERELEQDGLRFYLTEGKEWQLCLCGTGTWSKAVYWVSEAEIK